MKLVDINYLREIFLFGLQFGSDICNFISLYRPPTIAAKIFETMSTQSAFTCTKITRETSEQGVKHVQS